MKRRLHPASPHDQRRRQRSRPTPKWLSQRTDLDELARRRCLMILTVLSGAQPVSEAIEQAKISRGTYYQLETRALEAMLQALVPGAESAPATGPQQRIASLEEKVRQLEQGKRRADRLLFLTRQMVKPGPLTTGKGRPPSPSSRATRSTSTAPGKRSSRRSKRKTSPPTSSPSTPTPAGASAPSTGSES